MDLRGCANATQVAWAELQISTRGWQNLTDNAEQRYLTLRCRQTRCTYTLLRCGFY